MQIRSCTRANHMVNQQPTTTMVEKYLRISLASKEFQKGTLPLTQSWNSHAFLPQMVRSATFSTLKLRGEKNFFLDLS